MSVFSDAVVVITLSSSKDSGTEKDGMLTWAPLSFLHVHLPSFLVVAESQKYAALPQ